LQRSAEKIEAGMPWKETSTLEQRKEFIARWQRGEDALAELCREYDVSRQTAYKWIHRFEDSGEAGLQERSRAPHQIAWSMPAGISQRIVAVRMEHPRWGPRKILAYLQGKAPKTKWPAASSMGALLHREGLVVARAEP
jgi:transposase-like protein